MPQQCVRILRAHLKAQTFKSHKQYYEADNFLMRSVGWAESKYMKHHYFVDVQTVIDGKATEEKLPLQCAECIANSKLHFKVK